MLGAARPSLSGRCCIVAASDFHFGLARMFQVFLEGLGYRVRVTRDHEDACEWVESGIEP